MVKMILLVHAAAALVVLARALERLEHADPCLRGMSAHDRAAEVLVVAGWMLACAVALAPLMAVSGLIAKVPWHLDTLATLVIAALVVRGEARRRPGLFK